MFNPELNKIKSLIKKQKLVCAVEYDLNPHDDLKFGPYFTLGIIKNGKFCDFYYNSDLEYEEFQKLIPSCFIEVQESTYELHAPESLNTGLDILKKAGYSKFEDITGEYF